MKKISLILPFIILFANCNVNNTGKAQNIIKSESELLSANAQLDSLFKGYDYYHRFAGVVLVKIGNKVIYQGNFGYKNFEKEQLSNNNTVFGIASCSKQFTATAILKLIEKGQLTLDDNVYKFIPSLG